MKFRFALTAILTGTLLVPSLAAAKDYHGLWQAIADSSESNMFFLVLGADSHRLYDGDWKRIHRAKIRIDDSGNLKMEFRQGVISIFVNGKFENGSLKGNWVRPHPQVKVDLSWKGRRISKDADWQPWAFLHENKGRVINLLGAVLALDANLDEKGFRKSWTETIEPRFFALLTHSLYADGQGFYREELRRERVGKVLKVIKERRKELDELAGKFASYEKDVVKRLFKHYPWLVFEGYVVPGFSLGAFDYKYVTVNSDDDRRKLRRFMLFGSDWMAGSLSEVQTRYLIAQGLLTLDHLRGTRPDVTIRSEIAQRGIAAFLSRKLNYSEDPSDYLFQKDLEAEERRREFQGVLKKVGTHFSRRTREVWREFFLSDDRPASYLLSFDFARTLAKVQEPKAMLQQFNYETLRR